jgi:hypothetical protein
MYSSAGIDFEAIEANRIRRQEEEEKDKKRSKKVQSILKKKSKANRKRTKRIEEAVSANEKYYEEEMAKRQRLLTDEPEEGEGEADPDLLLLKEPTNVQYGNNRDALWGTTQPDPKAYGPIRDRFATTMEQLLHPNEPYEPEECFGCQFIEKDGTNVVYIDKWNALEKMFKEGLIETNSIFILAQQMHYVFHRDVVATIRESPISKEEKEYILGPPDREVWTPYQMAFHYCFHTKDPEVRAFIHLVRIQSCTDSVYANEMRSVDKETGHVLISKEGIAKLKELIGIEKQLYTWEPEKMLFHRKGARIPNHYLRLNPGRHVIRGHNLQHQFGGTHKQW